MSNHPFIAASLLALSAFTSALGHAEDVNVESFATPTKEINPPGKIPYQYDDWTDNRYVKGDRSLVLELPPVPSGKRLVVQQVSAVAETNDPALDVGCFVYAGTPDNHISQVSASHPLMFGPVTKISSASHDRVAARVASQPIALYVDADLAPEITCTFSEALAGHSAAVSGSVSGYLIDR